MAASPSVEAQAALAPDGQAPEAPADAPAAAPAAEEPQNVMVGSVGHILRSTFAHLYGGAPPPGSKPVARAAQMSLGESSHARQRASALCQRAARAMLCAVARAGADGCCCGAAIPWFERKRDAKASLRRCPPLRQCRPAACASNASRLRAYHATGAAQMMEPAKEALWGSGPQALPRRPRTSWRPLLASSRPRGRLCSEWRPGWKRPRDLSRPRTPRRAPRREAGGWFLAPRL